MLGGCLVDFYIPRIHALAHSSLQSVFVARMVDERRNEQGLWHRIIHATQSHDNSGDEIRMWAWVPYHSRLPHGVTPPESNRQLSAQGRSPAWDSRSLGLKRHYFLSFLMRWPVITLFLQDTGIRRRHSESFLLLRGLPLWSIYTVTASQLGVLPSASSAPARNGVSSCLGLQDIFQPIF